MRNMRIEGACVGILFISPFASWAAGECIDRLMVSGSRGAIAYDVVNVDGIIGRGWNHCPPMGRLSSYGTTIATRDICPSIKS